ncbi:MAG: HIT domain-containing protein [Alphaproteobacteria bacterium]|nr:HIT domain-containing protein [Alphaproteobacteria bacterium]
MSTIFTKIIERQIPAYIVAEDDHNVAFLDINPLVKGHLLVVPKQEVDYIFDLDNAAYSSLWLFAKKVALAMESVVSCTRVGIAVIGLEVPHVHIHLVPLRSMDDIDFGRPKRTLSKDVMETVSSAIKSAYDSLS